MTEHRHTRKPVNVTGKPHVLAPPPVSMWLRLCILTFIIGIATGLFAALLVVVMHGIEQLVYGQSEAHVLNVTEGTTATQRFIGIAIAGLIAGPAWAALRKYARPVRSVEEGMAGTHMPVFPTLVNVFLQMATVAAGASAGRENAPREAGAMMASWLSEKLQMDATTRKVLVAAAAGAGLGAIYHIPLAGAIFALEILLGSLSISAVMIVLACSAVATVTSSIVVGSKPLYDTITLSEGFGNLGAAIVLGIICATVGLIFRRLCSYAFEKAPQFWHSAWAIPAAFMTVGVIAIWLPEVIGNGRIAAAQVLMGSPTWQLIAILLVAKIFAVLITFRAGAIGGVLTPGFALGALSGYLVGSVIQPVFMPDVPLSDFAILGAAAFLSASMSAPFFALIVTVEFTSQSSAAYLPLFLATATAALTVAVWRSVLTWPVVESLPWNIRHTETPAAERD